MRSKLLKETPVSVKTIRGRWVRILPIEAAEYRLFDPLDGVELGRILFDMADNWIYDGERLSVYEQEEIAGNITGHEKEMAKLLESIVGY